GRHADGDGGREGRCGKGHEKAEAAVVRAPRGLEKGGAHEGQRHRDEPAEGQDEAESACDLPSPDELRVAEKAGDQELGENEDEGPRCRKLEGFDDVTGTCCFHPASSRTASSWRVRSRARRKPRCSGFSRCGSSSRRRATSSPRRDSQGGSSRGSR